MQRKREKTWETWNIHNTKDNHDAQEYAVLLAPVIFIARGALKDAPLNYVRALGPFFITININTSEFGPLDSSPPT